MSNKNNEIIEQLQQQLRENAEGKLDQAKPIALPFTNTTELLHELRVHEIELEMQNEELRRAQLALEESRDRYVDLYEFAPVGYLTLNLDGIITEINLTAATLLGVERVKLTRQRFAVYITAEDRERWYHHFLHIKQQGGKHQCELNLLRADGSPLYAHIDCLRIDSNDTLPVLRLTITDITARKQIEDALQASEARLTAILDGSELSTWDWNIQTGDCSFDERWTDICGYPLEEIEPHITFWKQSVFPNDLPCVQKALAAHLDGYTPFFTVEYRIRNKSGALLWVMDRGKVIERDTEGNALRMTGVVMNITQRKRIEQRLRIAAAAFETQAGIIITDEQQFIISSNQAFTHITGYSAREIIGHTPSFLRSGLHDEIFFQSIWAAIERDGYWQGEIWDKHKNGTIFPVWLTITSVIDTDDLVTHYVGSFTDITAQKEAEKVLLDARERLENQVASTQEELEKIREDSTKINTTLNVLLRHREADKCDAQNALSREVEGTVLPFLKRLKGANNDKNQTRLINILEDNLQQLVKFYGRDTSLSSVYQKLTPAEIQVASMVRQGLSTKLIATVLCLSPGTVGIHRKHIRKKLELDSQAINLYSYLTSLSE
ncbi:MAG: PAS domain S-box protein [Methylococcaceae bacterium]|nr:PAS domain S-box protein [Methylococcaceae bacterium]MDD1615464.1 PAS domain S-box protein [Methylococcaceae bacterium]OYV20254.1 MAG: Uncharacterized protein CG439_550 [Methylococcaceae bacterium NSP1-2]